MNGPIAVNPNGMKSIGLVTDFGNESRSFTKCLLFAQRSSTLPGTSTSQHSQSTHSEKTVPF